MTAISSAVDAAHPLDESRAMALWTFVQVKIPRFTSADALMVVRNLELQPGADVKALAKRLRAALQTQGVPLKHTHALQLAAQLAGFKSWHEGGSASTKRPLSLRLQTASWLNRELEGWDDAVDVISDYFLGDIKAKGLRSYRFVFTPGALGIQQPLLDAHNAVGRRVPLLEIMWDMEDSNQLRAAVTAAERVRRRFEESEHQAIVDGVAAIQYCLQNPHPDEHADDPLNSELVVVDCEPGPYSAAEVARGNELQCWRELVTLMEDNHLEAASPIELDGLDWVCSSTKRYRWQLETLRSTGGAVPQILTRELTREETAKLLRRRNRIVRNRSYLVPEDTVRRIQLFDSERLDVAVNWGAVSAHVLADRVAREVVDQALGMRKTGEKLSLRAFENLLMALNADDPQSFILVPARKQLALLKDDGLLRALVSRIEDVEPIMPRGLDEERAKKAQELVDSFCVSLRMDARDDDAPINFIVPRHSPYLISAGAGKDLLDGLAKLGLVAYGGLTTLARWLTRAGREGKVRSIRASRAFLLDIDYAESVSRGTENAFSGSLDGGEEEAK
ncbi:glyoxalase superfamily protein [Variovorax sp. N23]|uniref:glyoxalase superfamily protein n=1 Tax=Variovorax sp. N23 TaxID=2980555 RepID=UPI0021C64FF2|nr:glyoxalase superfamily protein [Variovorax sp. N23]MCU4120052.1 glyoxalase superfamily protein [Variovorax sp. N23]